MRVPRYALESPQLKIDWFEGVGSTTRGVHPIESHAIGLPLLPAGARGLRVIEREVGIASTVPGRLGLWTGSTGLPDVHHEVGHTTEGTDL